VHFEALGHEPLDAEHGLEPRDRVLKDHADLAAAHRPHLVLGQREQVAIEKLDAAADAGVWRC